VSRLEGARPLNLVRLPVSPVLGEVEGLCALQARSKGIELTVSWYRSHEDWWRRRKSADFWDYYRRNYRGLPANAVPP